MLVNYILSEDFKLLPIETVVVVDILLKGVSATHVYSPTFLGDKQSMNSLDFVDPRRKVSTSALCLVFSNVASSSEIFGRAPCMLLKLKSCMNSD